MKPISLQSLVILVGLLLWGAPAVKAESFRKTRVNFELKEARYNASGDYVGDFPIESVKIRIRPDLWTAGPRSTTGFSLMSGNVTAMENLFVDIPESKAKGTAMAHLELGPNQPWGNEEKHLLWKHGYGSGRHDAPFPLENERGDPLLVLLIPIEHADKYYRQRVLTSIQEPGGPSSSYYSSLVNASMLGVEFSEDGQALASNFAERRDKAIQEAAAYWGVEPTEIASGFDQWAHVIATSPAPQDKVLLAAYSGDLDQAALTSQELAKDASATKDAENLWLHARVNLSLGRDLLAKDGGRFPASGSRTENLEKAMQAFKDASQAVASLKVPGKALSPIEIETKDSVDEVLKNWKTPLTPPSKSMKIFTLPAGR